MTFVLGALMHVTFSKLFIWIVLFSNFSISSVFAQSLIVDNISVSGNIVFDNFSKKIVLVKKTTFFQIQDSAVNVQLSNRIIVKTTTALNKQQVSQLHPQINKVVILFNGTSSHYFSIEIKDATQLAKVIFDLQTMQKKQPESGIMLVQPDILQLQSKATLASLATSTKNKTAENRSHTKRDNDAYSPYIALLNIQPMWNKSKGAGVKVAIIDDGFYLQHADLQHIKTTFSYDSQRKILSSQPVSALDTHGTKVAGIIFAAHNSIGIDGIAPEAELIAIRQANTWTSQTLLNFQLAKLAGASIINCSWHSQLLLQPFSEIVDDLATNGRQGKGIAVVISAGNDNLSIKANSIESAIASAIVVGASGKKSQRLAFSNYGPSVDFYAYGKTVQSTLISGNYGNFSGTSLAAAITSGLAALLLSQQPELTVAQLTQQLQQLQPIQAMKQTTLKEARLTW